MTTDMIQEPRLAFSGQENLWLKEVSFKLPEKDEVSVTAFLKEKYNLLSIDDQTDSRASSPDNSQENKVKAKGHVFNATFPELGTSSSVKGNGVTNGVTNGLKKLPEEHKKSIVANPQATLTEVPTPKHVIHPATKLTLEWPRMRPIGPGLRNLGNTCFMNSVLQCLTYCPPLVHSLMTAESHSKLCLNSDSCMACMLKHHFERVYSGKFSGMVIAPHDFAKKLKMISKSFNFGSQEDAHEYLRHLIDNMCRSAITAAERRINSSSNGATSSFKYDPRSRETTLFNHIFGGYLRSQITCFTCKSTSNTYDHFMDLMLDIKQVDSLEKALRKFTTPEKLDEENSYKCVTCRKKSAASKKFTIETTPAVLTIQLKRFEYNRIFEKVQKHVSFPEELDLKSYTSDPRSPSIIYKLFAVLVHEGHSCKSGHYFSYVKNSNNFWYRMDDDSVSKSNPNIVLSQKAYILFYVKKASSIPTNGSTPVGSTAASSNGIMDKKFNAILNPQTNGGPRIPKIGVTSNSFIGPVLPKRPTLSDPTVSPVKKDVPVNKSLISSNSSLVLIKSNGKGPAIITEKPKVVSILGNLTNKKSSPPPPLISPPKNDSNKRLVNYSDESGDEDDQPAPKKWKQSEETNGSSSPPEKNGIRITSNSNSSSTSVSSLSPASSNNSPLTNDPDKGESENNEVAKSIMPSKSDVPVMNGSNCVITKGIIHKESNFDVENGSLLHFGSNVKSWDGATNSNDKAVEKSKLEEERLTREEDEYNAEFDAGKTKKVKKKLGNGMLYNSLYTKSESKKNSNAFELYQRSNVGRQDLFGRRKPFITHKNRFKSGSLPGRNNWNNHYRGRGGHSRGHQHDGYNKQRNYR